MVDDKNIDDLRAELGRFTKGLSSISDSMRQSIRDGVIDGFDEIKKKKTSSNDTEKAENTHSRLVNQLKTDSDVFKDMRRSTVTDPNKLKLESQFAQTKELKTLNEQLSKLLGEDEKRNNKKKDSIGKPIKSEYDKQQYKYDSKADTATNLMGGLSQMWSGIKGMPSQMKGAVSSIGNIYTGIKNTPKSIKNKVSDASYWAKDTFVDQHKSKKRIDEIKKSRDLYNKDSAILSGVQSKLDEEQKKRGSNRNAKLIEELKTRKTELVDSRKISASTIASNTASEKLYQKGKENKEFRFNQFDAKILEDQMRGNIFHTLISDIQSKKPQQKAASKDKQRTVDGLDSSSIIGSTLKSRKQRTVDGLDSSVGSQKSIIDTRLNITANPSTYGEHIGGIYQELKKLNSSFTGIKSQKEQIPQQLSGGGGGIFDTLSKLAPLLALLAGGAGAIGLQQLLKKLGIGDASAGGNVSDDLTVKGTKTAANVAAKMGVTALGKTAATTAGKATAKTVAKSAGKGLAKSALKKIPLVGAGAGLVFGAQRAMQGDLLGAGMEVASGGLSLLPGIGTAASIGMDAALLGRDVYKAKQNTSGSPTPPVNNVQPETIKEHPQPRQTINTKTTMSSMSMSGGMDQLTAMTIQAKLIAMEMMNMQKNPDYINQQKTYMKETGRATATTLLGD